jgi:hypothetical protein
MLPVDFLGVWDQQIVYILDGKVVLLSGLLLSRMGNIIMHLLHKR